MTPNVDAFIVYHEETLEDFFWSVEIDPVSMCDMLIVFHIFWGSVIVSNSSC